jgi:hypothetical protein
MATDFCPKESISGMMPFDAIFIPPGASAWSPL